MKKNVLIKVLFVSLAFLLTQCFEEVVQTVEVIPYEEIDEKLKELRDLQKELSDETVTSVDLQAQIDDLIAELNELIPPGNVPLTYSIGIVSTNAQDQLGIANAVVTIHIRDREITATSNSSGQVVFEDLRSGVALVHITHPSYTDVSFVVDLLVNAGATADGDKSGDAYNVTSVIGLYPTTASLGAAVHSGTLFFDPDRTNDILQITDPNYGRINYFASEVTANSANLNNRPYAPPPRLTLTNGAEDAIPTVFPILDARVQTWVPLNVPVDIFVGVRPDPFYYSFVPPGTEGNIIIAVYEEMFVRTTSSATGTYSITVPDAYRSLTINYRLTEFLGTETYFRAQNLNTTVVPNTTTFTSRVRNVVFVPMYREIVADNYGFPGAINAFDPTLVNNFNVIWNRSLSSVPLNFYFGAKSRNE
jgi:hypothetical protein